MLLVSLRQAAAGTKMERQKTTLRMQRTLNRVTEQGLRSRLRFQLVMQPRWRLAMQRRKRLQCH